MSEEESRKKVKFEGEDPKNKKKVAFQMRTFKKVTVTSTASQTISDVAEVGAGEALMAAIERCKTTSSNKDAGEEAAAVPESQNEKAPSKDLSMPLL